MESSRGQSPQVFVALLLSESSSDQDDYRPLWQEDVVLVHATSIEEAREKARQRGLRGETSFVNADGETITWRFRTVVDVQAALGEDLTQDTDLYSRTFRDHEAYARFEPLLGGEQL